MIACKNSIVSEYADTVVVDDLMIDQTIQGVSFKDTSGVISNSYIGCHSTFPDSFAVRLWGTVAPVDSVRVHDNFLWNSNTTTGHYGLLIYGTTIPVRFSEIHHNTFQDADCGIMIAGGATHLSNDINFNQFVSCSNGIYVSAGATNNHISWNKMRSITTPIYDGGTGTIKTSNYDEDVVI
jgi:nitrous oxidase accessory protein NosD